MVKQFPIYYWLLSMLVMGITPMANGQILTNQAVLTIQSGSNLTIQGDLTNDGSGEVALEGQMTVEGSITNNSSANLTTGTGTTVLKGTNQQSIGGSNLSRFADLNLENAAGLQLGQNVELEGQLIMTDGNIDLNGQTIDLGSTGEIVGEADNRRISGSPGTITTTRDLGVPGGANIAGMGVAITSGANLGQTTIERKHNNFAIGSGVSIDRSFDIAPANNTSLDATLRIDYFTGELNGQNPNDLKQWRGDATGTNWVPGITTNSGTGFVEGGPYNSMALWTLSNEENITSIGDLLPAISVKYYPNPVQSGTQIFVEGLIQGKYDLVLSDMRGRQVWNTKTQIFNSGEAQNYQLPSLAEGVYSLQIISPKHIPTTGMIEILSN